MKIYFDKLSGYDKHPKGRAYFIADCINWCEANISQRKFYIGAKPNLWDTIKKPGDVYALMPPPPIGISFIEDEAATAFLLVFK